MPSTSLDTCSPAQHSRSLLLILSHDKLIRRKMQIQPCHYVLDTCKSIRTAPSFPDMYIVHHLQALRSINRTLVILKRQFRVKKNKKKALVVKCILVLLMSNVKKLLNLIISLSLLYLVLCSIPHFHVVFYMFLAYKAANGGVFLRCGTLSQNRLQVQHLVLGKNGLHNVDIRSKEYPRHNLHNFVVTIINK